MNKSKKKYPALKLMFPVLVVTLLLFAFTSLLKAQFTGDSVYGFLISITLITGFAIYHIDNVSEIALGKAKLVLREAEEIKGQIQKIGRSIINIVALHSAYTSGSWKQRKLLNDQLEETLRTPLETNKKEVIETMKTPRIMEKAMKQRKEKLSKEEQEVVDKLFCLSDSDTK